MSSTRSVNPTEPEAEAKRWFREVSGSEWPTGYVPYVAVLCRAHARHVLEHRALAGSDLIAGRTVEDWRRNIPHTGCDNRDALEMVDLIVALRAERRRPGDETVVANIMHDAAAKSGQMISSNQSDFMARAVIDACGLLPSPPQITEPFQVRVDKWIHHCFGETIRDDKIERNHRFIEEALELVQSGGCTASEAHQLVDYVFARPVGEMKQEVGGVMNTLAALCNAYSIDMDDAAEIELTRVWGKSDQIRAKQAAKPKHSPLPVAWVAAPPHITDADVLRCAEVVWPLMSTQPWAEAHQSAREYHIKIARACLEAFLSPPAPDPRIAIVVAQIRAACEGMDADAQRVARDVLAALDGVKADG